MSENPISCLLIDDDEQDQEIFELALNAVGKPFDLKILSSCIDGLKKLHIGQSYIPKHIFLDLNMPEMDGFECLTEIKKLSHLENSEVIIYSTSSYMDDIRKSEKLGATAFITKTSTVRELTEILSLLFSNSLPKGALHPVIYKMK